MKKFKKGIKRRLFSIVLAFALAITLLPSDFGGRIESVNAASGFNDWTIVKLESTSAGGNTQLQLNNKTIYKVTQNLTYTGNAGKCPLYVQGSSTAVIYVAKGCKLYVKGGNASGQSTTGQPGIKIPNTSTLIITGEGTVQAVGGNGGNGSSGSSGGGSWFNGKKANSMWIGGGGNGGVGGAGAGAGIGGAGGSGGNRGGGGSGTTRTTDPSPFHWNGNRGGNGYAGGAGAAMGNLYVLGTVSVTATGGSRGSAGGSGGGTGYSASDAGSGFSNDYRTGASGGGGGGGYGSAATAIGGGAGGGGGGGGGGTGGCAVNAGYPAGGGGSGGASGGGRGAGYVSASGGNSGAYGGGGGAAGAAGGAGYFYKADTASVSGRTPNETRNSHPNIEYDITIDGTAENVTGAKNITMTYGASLISKIPVPSRRGYTLGGLYANEDGSGQKYFDAEGNPDLSLFKNEQYADEMGYWFETKNLPLYPKWIPNSYTLVCNATGGSGGGSYPVDYDANLPTISTPSKVGYKFAGLYSEKDGKGKQYMDEAGNWLCNIDESAIEGSAKWRDKIDTVTLYAKWVPIDYAIQLYSDGEYIDYDDPDTVGTVSRDGGTIKGSGVTYGTFTLPSAEDIGLKKAHYNFLGWNIYDEQDWAMYKAGTVYRGGLTTVDEDVVSVYAAWEIMDNYAIIYNGNGGTKVPGAENAFDGDPYTIPDVTPQRNGYTFVGWSEDADCEPTDTDKILHGKDTIDKVEHGYVLYAVWKDNPAVAYNANGGIFSTNIEKKKHPQGVNVAVDFDNLPHRTGYTFQGWSTDPSAKEAEYKKGVTESFDMPEKSVTLYAVWKADEIAVYYDMDSVTFYTIEAKEINGSDNTLWDPARGEGSSENTTVHATEYAANYSFVVKVPKSLDDTGLSVYVNGAKQKNVLDESETSCKKYTYMVKNVQGELDITIGGAENIYYSLKYHLDGGSWKVADPVVPADPVDPGEGDPGEGDPGEGDPVDPEVPDDTPANEYVYGEGVELPASDKVERTGYTFGGWYLDPTYEDGSVRTAILPSDDGNKTVYAKWTPISYTLQFDLNGGTDKPDATAIDGTSKIVKYNDEVVLPTGDSILSPVLTDESGTPVGVTPQHYDFLGWSTNKNDKEAEFLGGFDVAALTTTDGDTITLYAIWATPESQLSLDANGGKFTVTQDTYGEDGEVNGTEEIHPTMITKQTHVTRVMPVNSLEKPEREGYTFIGWSKSSNAKTATYTDEHVLYITSESITLYAVWEPATYKLTFDYNVPDGAKYSYDVYQNDSLEDVGDAAFVKTTQDMTYGEASSLKPNEYGVVRYDKADTQKNHPTVMKFAGWSSDADATAPEYLNEQKVLNLWTPDMGEAAKQITLYAVWTEAEVYYLNYDVNGGSWKDGKAAQPKAVAKDSTLLTSVKVKAYADDNNTEAVPQRTGYSFAGWDADSSKDAVATTYKAGALDAASMSASDVKESEGKTLYAIWAPKTYKIIYAVDEDVVIHATGEVDDNAYDSEITLFGKADFEKADHTLLGWTTSDALDAAPEYQPGAKVKNLKTGETGEESITLYAVWIADTDKSDDDVWLSYNTDGGTSVAPTKGTLVGEVEKTATVTLASAPAKTGYTFDGWLIGGETKAASDTVDIDADTTAEAQWTANNYDIKYDLNTTVASDAGFVGGKPDTESTTYDAAAINLYDADDVNSAKYTLLGWATQADGGVVYQPGQPVKNLATGEAADDSITLYAVWKQNVSTYITYDANGGKFTSIPKTTIVVKGQAEAVIIQAVNDSAEVLTPTKTGYVFAGWAKTETATTADYNNGDSEDAAEFATNTTLFAVWTPKTYSIVYDANDTTATFTDGTAVTTSRTQDTDVYKRNLKEANYGEDVTLYAVADVTLLKHKLKGWATDPQGDIVYQPGQIVKNLKTGETDDDSIELYAVWESMGEWKIRYHANGGENAPTTGEFLKEEVDGSFKATASIADEEPVRDGYTFKGWSTDKTDGTVEYSPGDSGIILTEDLVLFAVWEEIVIYGISYDANGGAGKCPFDTHEYSEGDKADILFDPQPIRAGYQFAGWSIDKDAEEPEFYKDEAEDTAAPEEGGTPEGGAPEGGAPEGGDDGDSGDNGHNKLTVSCNTILYAVWEENTYDLKFYNGGVELTETTYSEYAKIPFSKKFKMPEYTGAGAAGMVFAGWATSNGGEAVFTTEDGFHEGLVTENGGSLNLYVAWKPTKVNVTIIDEKDKVKLKADETVSNNFVQTYGEALPDIVQESCTGYIFKGIYDASDNQIYDGDGQPNGSSTFVSDVTLTAKWVPVTYKLNYEQLGNVISSETITYDNSFKIRGEADIKNLDVPSGYALVGWSLIGMNDTSGTIYKPGQILENNELFKNGSDITLYPIIQVDQSYRITYNANGGSRPPMDNTPYKFGDNAKIKTSSKPVKEGYTFAGWTNPTIPDEIYAADEECTVQVKTDITLYAEWTPNEYKICYHNNYGGTDVTITDVINYDKDDYSFRSVEELEAPAEEGGDIVSLKRDGCALIGWSTSKSGSVNYDPGSEMYQPLTRKSNQTVHLYAVWDKNAYTISYDKNAPADAAESVTGVMLNQVMHYDDEQRLYNNRYALTGYDFLGWATSSDAATAEYTDEEIVKNLTTEKGATVTLYAVWAVKKLNVEFKAQGHGTAPAKQTVSYNELVTKPADLTCEGYLFKGWYKDSDYSEIWTFETDKVTNDVILYAKWNEILATVKTADGTVVPFDDVKEALEFAESNEGTSTVNLKHDISVDSTLTIPENVILDIDIYKILLEKLATLINNGIITGTGSIEGEGTFDNNGVVEGVTVDESIEVIGGKDPTNNHFTVEFISKGEVVKEYHEVVSNSLITEPEMPDIAGFAGWYKDEACTIIWNFDTDKVRTDTKIYAKYSNTVKVTFSPNGGTFKETVNPIEVTVGSKIDEATLRAVADKAVNGSMTFSGWYKDEYDTAPWDCNEDVVTENIILYIGWGYPAGHEDVAELSVTKVKDYVYTGKKITPAVSVSFGGNVLVPGTDYTVTYKNNVKAYDSVSRNNLEIKEDGSIDYSKVDEKNAPTIIIKGKKNYSSKTIALNFNILPISLGTDGELAEDVSADICDGFVTNPKGVIKVKETVSYKGKKLGTKDYTLKLVPEDAVDASGKALPKTELAKQEIPKGAKGTFTLTAEGKGNYAGGFVKTVTVKDNVLSLEKAKISVKRLAYSGSDLTVEDLLNASKGKLTVKVGSKTLEYGKDFTVEFTGDNKAGSRTNGGVYPIVITGKGDYMGSRMANVTVTGVQIGKAEVILENASPVYSGSHNGANIKSVTVMGKHLTAGIDYDAVASNDVKAGTAKVTITGKGVYTGTKKISYKIQKKVLTADMFEGSTGNNINLSEHDYYGGIAVTPDVSISYNGVKLVNPEDYTVSAKNNKKAGSTAEATITGKGNYTGKVNATFTIGKDEIDTSKIAIKNAFIKISDQTYTGRAITIDADDIALAENKKLKKKLELGKDFEFVDGSYFKNVNVGKAQCVVKGIGDYDGYMVVTFKIVKKDLKWWQNSK